MGITSRGRQHVRIGALLASCLVTAASVAHAQPSRIERGVAYTLLHGRPGLDLPGTASVVIELAAGATVADVESLPGVTLARLASGPIAWRSFVPARIDPRGLAALEAASSVARVRLGSRPGRPPLDVTTALVGIAAARAALPYGATGEGVLIADVDTLIDVFHPAFFRADAGYFDWIDRNSDGVFSPGDAVDLDRDGRPGGTESATILPAAAFDEYGEPVAGVRRGAFDPSVDWLFLDLNGDGVRNVGSAAGWGDDSPGLGEPLFVPDDVDRDGRLEPSERVVQLGSSKIRDVLLSLPSGPGSTTTTEFIRGAGLANIARDYTGGSHGYADTLHATGVAGILIGDVPLIGRRLVGMAPDAELIVSADFSRVREFSLAWVLEQSPDVVLHEYVNWTDVLLDGSDPVSAMIDASAADIAHVCPAGNIGGRGKHAEILLAPGETREISFRAAVLYPTLTVHVPLGASVGLVLIEPSGAEHDHGSGPFTLATGERLYAWEIPTTRAFEARSFAFNRLTIPAEGTPWRVRVRGDPSVAVTIHAYLGDENGFAQSAAWSMPDETSTLAWPATADGCIAVAAFAGHGSTEAPWFASRSREAAGDLRVYSARGPRIDSLRTIGVAAPDNPWSALGAGDVYPSDPGVFIAPEGALQVFGGTSGAGPHVAGTVALLVQAGTRGMAALAAITSSATADVTTGAVPNDGFGHGRLNAAAALGSLASPNAPRITLFASRLETRVLVTPVVVDDDGDAVSIRWDLEYDGVWETDFVDAEPRTVDLPAGGLRVKVRARDASGRVDEAVLFVRRLEDIPVTDAGLPDAGPLGGGGGGGCGCRAPATPTHGRPLVMLSAMIAWLARRRPRA